MISTVEPGKLYYETGRAMLENNPLPYDVKLWMPGTYLWLAVRIDSPYLEGSRIGNWWGQLYCNFYLYTAFDYSC